MRISCLSVAAWVTDTASHLPAFSILDHHHHHELLHKKERAIAMG
jgi:hypothetical protein